MHQMWSYCGETQTCKSYLSGGEKAGDLFSGTEDLSIFFSLRGLENSFLPLEQKGMYCGPEDLSPSISFLGREETHFYSKIRRDECIACQKISLSLSLSSLYLPLSSGARKLVFHPRTEGMNLLLLVDKERDLFSPLNRRCRGIALSRKREGDSLPLL